MIFLVFFALKLRFLLAVSGVGGGLSNGGGGVVSVGCPVVEFSPVELTRGSGLAESWGEVEAGVGSWFISLSISGGREAVWSGMDAELSPPAFLLFPWAMRGGEVV